MTLASTVAQVRDILYGSVIGEKPAIRIAASDAAETGTSPKIIFTLDTSEGDHVRAGDVLSVRGGASAAASFVVYVLSKSSDTITALNAYQGTAVTGSDSGDLDNAVFEQNAPVTEYQIFNFVEQVYDSLLYPHVTKLNQRQITPDLSDYQNEIPAAVEKIRSAWQVISGEAIQIPFDLERNLDTTISSTGSLVYLGAIDGSTVYVVTEEKYTSSDTVPNEIEYCVAVGAAALAAGAQVHERSMASASKDSQLRAQSDPSATLWRDFLTLRTSIMEEQAEEVDYFEIIR